MSGATLRKLPLGPLVIAVECGLLLAAPALLVLAALASPLVGGRRPLRVVAILLAYCWHHVLATAACLVLGVLADHGSRRSRRAHYAVMSWFVNGVYHAIERSARVHVHHAGTPQAEAVLADRRRPVVVLARHAGEGDTLLVLHHLLSHHGRHPRVVMHEALAIDPLIALLGRRLPNRFVDPRGGDTEKDIAEMSRDLGGADAVVIFPEGGNYNAERRRRGIERLEEAGLEEEASWARAMEHVIAPRPGGALAALESAPTADVVLLGHHGFPTSLGDAWRHLHDRQVIEVRTWLHPAAEVPEGHDAQIDWLWARWRELDAWVAERAG